MTWVFCARGGYVARPLVRKPPSPNDPIASMLSDPRERTAHQQFRTHDGHRLTTLPFVAGLTLVASSAFAQAPNPTRTPVAPVARAADEPQRRWNRLGRPTAAAASRGNVLLFCGLGNHVDLRGVLGGAEVRRTSVAYCSRMSVY
jgi:hypothetical protein